MASRRRPGPVCFRGLQIEANHGGRLGREFGSLLSNSFLRSERSIFWARRKRQTYCMPTSPTTAYAQPAATADQAQPECVCRWCSCNSARCRARPSLRGRRAGARRSHFDAVPVVQPTSRPMASRQTCHRQKHNARSLPQPIFRLGRALGPKRPVAETRP